MSLGWLGIVRLGLVQTALGAIVVLTTSTINRLMIVELALPAMLPGILVTWHYALQVLRPRWGHGSDGGRRTPWIVGGMGVLALGGILAAASIHVMTLSFAAGVALAAVAFTLIGIGVGASGTSLLALLAQSVDGNRRAAAATIVWIMMIAGFIATATTVGQILDPFSPPRLVAIASAVCLAAFLFTCLAVVGVEREGAAAAVSRPARKPPFKQAIAQVWADTPARRFAVFVFVSMLAYSMQDLILEPFAGIVFNYSPGQSTVLSGVHSSGVLAGMLLVGIAATLLHKSGAGGLRNWTIGGCAASALALIGLVAAAQSGPAWPLKPTVFALGFANGVFAVAAIGSMFNLATANREQREGVRMGVFGAAQAVAFGLGGFAGTFLVDAIRFLGRTPVAAYGAAFAAEACLFIAAALIAARIGQAPGARENPLILAGRHHAGA
jgi:BCD family chlorophyll transporter-like MFS transporter